MEIVKVELSVFMLYCANANRYSLRLAIRLPSMVKGCTGTAIKAKTLKLGEVIKFFSDILASLFLKLVIEYFRFENFIHCEESMQYLFSTRFV